MQAAWLTRDLSIKLFSLLMALTLFFFVSVESDRSVDVDFPIEYRIADDITLTGDYPTSVNVTLAGPWASLRSYEGDKLSPITVDLTNIGPGQVRHRIDAKDIPSPGGMKVVTVRPAELELALDRKVERQVPVQVDLGSERPVFGYEITDVQVEPQRVRVVGPAMALQTLDFVYTRPLDVASKETAFSADVDLRPPPPPLRLRERRVKVTVEIREEFVTRVFSTRVEPKNLPTGAKVEIKPNPVKIELRGPRRIVDGFDKQTLVAYVDLMPELDEGEREFEKPIELNGQPERTLIPGLTPAVQVRVSKLPKRKR